MNKEERKTKLREDIKKFTRYLLVVSRRIKKMRAELSELECEEIEDLMQCLPPSDPLPSSRTIDKTELPR